MQEHLAGHIMEKKRKRDMLDEQNPYRPHYKAHEEDMYAPSEHDDEIEEIAHLHSKAKGKAIQATQSKAAMPKINSYFQPRTTSGAQRTLKSVLQSKEVNEKCDLAISKWMLATGIPFNTVNSPYYQQAIDAITSMGAGYKGPGFHDLRGYLLTKNVEEVRKYVDSYRSIWKETGCTIMADGWTYQCRRTLINFLVYCPKGTVFLKSVDASDASKTGEMLYKLFREVVLFVGQENVVHFVTDNAANYVAAGHLLEQEFKTIFWSHCAAHCINLILSDIGKLDEVNDIVTHAAKITKYIYNHCFCIEYDEKIYWWTRDSSPCSNSFCHEFHCIAEYIGTTKCIEGYVQISEPLVRVLRIVDSDERPAMGYLLEAMYKAREEMLKRFNRRKKKLEPYINILDARWDRQLHKNLHTAGYWLNPKYQYDLTEIEKNRGTVSGLLDVIERYSYGKPSLQTKLTSEMKIFKNAEGDFGRVSAVSDHTVMAPDEWWMWYGSRAPNLQKLAIRVLSQTCSASGCERNWSLFEHVHSKKRNRLEHQRLNDLVYVHYNLKLQQRNYFKGRNYDPIDFEKFASYSTWVLEDEPTTLSNEELRTFRRDLQMCIQETGNDDLLNLNLEDLDMGDEAEDNIDGGNVNDRGQENIFFGAPEAPNDVAAEDNIRENYGGDWSAWNC
ncbi:uncharacterized protein LOC116204424 [Punica granatum]|uniref:Uncharacterized protein LOC116204424 n=1 Tax=Punica granatum TaxID=22663 RepID=A0A6P8D6Z2_PUNGR|nr:uncharacterized protein LOC116204424 [Punica granatum]